MSKTHKHCVSLFVQLTMASVQQIFSNLGRKRFTGAWSLHWNIQNRCIL